MKKPESPAIIINSVPDHVHILFRLSKNLALAKIIEDVKKDSSKWMKEEYPKFSDFSWQIGYGAFSVSSSMLEVVKRYIRDQEEHHKKITYQEEVEVFMKEYGVIRLSTGLLPEIICVRAFSLKDKIGSSNYFFYTTSLQAESRKHHNKGQRPLEFE